MTENMKRLDNLLWGTFSFYLNGSSVTLYKKDAHFKLVGSKISLDKISSSINNSDKFQTRTKHKLYRSSDDTLYICNYEDDVSIKKYKELVAVVIGMRLLALEKKVIFEKELYLEALKDLCKV